MPKVYQARWVRETGDACIEACERGDDLAFPALYEREKPVGVSHENDLPIWDWVADFVSEEHMRAVLADGLKLIPILGWSEVQHNADFSWRC